MTPRALTLLALAPLAIGLAACGSSTSSSSTHAGPGGKGILPDITVLKNSPKAANGDIFLAPKVEQGGEGGPLIMTPKGKTVWFQPNPPGQSATDFRVQTYRGKPVLTWWQGRIGYDPTGSPPRGTGRGVDMIYNTHYKKIAEVHAGDGESADLHEFQLTPQGTALITAYKTVHLDLSGTGGSKHAAVLDSIVQEVDVKTGKVLLDWNSLDHVPLRATYAPRPSNPDEPWDYFHVNAVSLDNHGNLLISGRNTWAIYDVDRHTGAIRWRLGGKNSDFALGPEVRFAWQHDARMRPGNIVSMFDNEAAPKEAPKTRGLFLKLDFKRMRATVVRSYTHDNPPLLAPYEGNVEPLQNGDVFMGWGGLVYMTEFSPGGKVLYDAKMPAKWDSYRTYRFPWPPKKK